MRNRRYAVALSAEICPYVWLPERYLARRAEWTLLGRDTRPGNGSGCWGAGVSRFRAPELNGPHPRQTWGIAKGYSPLPAFFWVLFLAEQEKYEHSAGAACGRDSGRALRAPTCDFPNSPSQAHFVDLARHGVPSRAQQRGPAGETGPQPRGTARRRAEAGPITVIGPALFYTTHFRKLVTKHEIGISS